MAKQIFLNMSDDLGLDGRKAIDALRIKFPRPQGYFKSEQVKEIMLVDFYRDHINGVRNRSYHKTLNKIKNECMKADRVLLSLHGPMRSVNYGIIKAPVGSGRQDEHVTDQQLADLLLIIFTRSHCYNLSLVMCFGARSSQYALDHQNLDAVDWSDSFAYNLFNRISPRRQIRMTARTGELSFNTLTGIAEVQSEMSVQGTIDNAEIRHEQLFVDSQNWWNTHIAGLMNPPGSAKALFVIALETARLNPDAAAALALLRQLRRNHGLPARDAQSRELLNYLGNLIRLTEASVRQLDPVKNKYGKLVYRHFHGSGNCVFVKYPVTRCVHPKHLGQSYPVPTDYLRKFAHG
ncbi:hypothetical protein [Psychromonas aquimarina]|uniref:hypothetical protein n=1 Tax=Psychromonas aquimarina TaxID=444919 RepID=UPI0003F8B438|nr:hypothetical protein [Psychromonas aquimarina]